MAKKDNRFRATKKATVKIYTGEAPTKKPTSIRGAKKAVEKLTRTKEVTISYKPTTSDNIQVSSSTLNSEQYFTQQRGFRKARFLERIEVIIKDPFKLLEIANHMETMSDAEIQDMIRVSKLNATYYASDNSWNVFEVTAWSGEDLYAFIMSA